MEPLVSYPTLAARAITQEDIRILRTICDEYHFSYGVFCALIIADVLHSPELRAQYISKVQQFEDDRKPASIEEMKALRERLRQQEDELESLREFKRSAQNSLNSMTAH